VRAAVAAWLCAGAAVPARAQIYEVVGIRAQGMGGAFVAVADDATATWWNPAGLATGAYFSSIFERGQVTDPGVRTPDGVAWRGDTRAFAVVFPALGLSYYRVRISEVTAPGTSTEGEGPGRQDMGIAGPGLRSLAASQFGVSVGQSIGNHLVIASTLKLVRAGLAVSPVVSSGDQLDAAADLSVSRETKPDLDVGAMVALGTTRLGLTIRNVREPEFGDGANRFALRRQARAGIAFTTQGFLTVGLDADLSKTATALGDARHVAAGIEAWLLRRRVGLRGGVSANTVGETSSSTSAGVSIGVRSGVFVDGALTVGSDRSREGWSAGVRLSY
jgi:hypothetical protein